MTAPKKPASSGPRKNTAAPKKPQDHKAKAPAKAKVNVETVDILDDEGKPTGETYQQESLTAKVRGVVWRIPAENFDDFELMGWLREQEHDITLMPRILDRLLGEEQFHDAMNLLRGPNGRVNTEDGSTFLGEIFEIFNPNS